MNQSRREVAHSSKIKDIEILRAIGVIFVIIHHSHGNLVRKPHELFDIFYSYFQLGIGVDIFFAVSGFVIARQLVPGLLACESVAQRASHILTFWLRRAWRLLPSAWLWLLIILVSVVFYNQSHAFGHFRPNYESTIAAFLQVANFRFADVVGHSEYGASFVYWSLSLEEQFYLLFPFLILLLRGRLAWGLAAIALIQLVTPRTSIGMLLRTDSIAAGCLIALWQSHFTYQLANPCFMRYRALRWVVLSVLLVFIGSAGSLALHIIPYQFSLVTLIAVILVFFASYDREYVIPPAFMKPFLLWAGSRSYSLYLVHVPAFFFTRETFYRLAQMAFIDADEHWLRMTVVSIALMIFLAEINYRYVEVPCRRYGARLAKEFASSH